MRLEKQFSIFMVNKTGVLAQILGELAKASVNITALTVMDSAEHGVMRVVSASPERLKAALEKLNLQFSETEVLCVNLANKSGAFASITEKLAKAHINIAYAYCTAGARGGRTTGVIKVADVKKAIKVLKDNGFTPTKSKSGPKVRKEPTVKK